MKYAIITGSTKGIGKAIAQKLLANGYFCFISYSTDDAAAEDIRLKLAMEFDGAFSIDKADLASLDGLNTYLDYIRSRTDAIDCLVLNVGATDRSSFREITATSWQKVLDTNLTVPLFFVKGCQDLFRPGSSVLFISSLLGQVPHATSLAYGVTKAAVSFLARSLVKEFAGQGVRVNAVAPGFVDTPWQSGKDPAIRRSIEGKIAVGRFAQPEEIADLCHQVIENTYINGSVIDIDGGYDFR